MSAYKVLKTKMKDPSSMQIHEIICFRMSSGDKMMVVFDVTGKNGLGGVSRSTAAFSVKTKSGYATYDKGASMIPFQMYVGSRVDVNEVLKRAR